MIRVKTIQQYHRSFQFTIYECGFLIKLKNVQYQSTHCRYSQCISYQNMTCIYLVNHSSIVPHFFFFFSFFFSLNSIVSEEGAYLLEHHCWLLEMEPVASWNTFHHAVWHATQLCSCMRSVKVQCLVCSIQKESSTVGKRRLLC